MISPNYPRIKYKHIAHSVYPCKSASHNFTPAISGHALGRSTPVPIYRLTFIDNPIKLQLTADIQVKSRGQLIPGYVRYLSARGGAPTSKGWSISGNSRGDRVNNIFLPLSRGPRLRFPFLILPSASPFPIRQYMPQCERATRPAYVGTNLEPGNDYTNKKAVAAAAAVAAVVDRKWVCASRLIN